MIPTGLKWATVSEDGARVVVVDLTLEDRDERVRLSVGCEPIVWFDGDRRSILLYCETCLVDHGGRLFGARLTRTDFENLRLFKRLGLLDFGAMDPAAIEASRLPDTHWVAFTDLAYLIAHALRREQVVANPTYRQQRGAEGSA